MFLQWLVIIFWLPYGSLGLKPAAPAKEDKKIICYFSTTAKYRSGSGRFSVDNIDPNLCTHLVYGTVSVENNGLLSTAPDQSNGDIEKLKELKLINPSLRLLHTISLWSGYETNFMQMAYYAPLRQHFIRNVVTMLLLHNFNGIVLVYPKEGNRLNCASLVKELHAEFARLNLQLLVWIDGRQHMCDIREISPYVDYFNIRAFDFHSASDTIVIPGALYSGPWERPGKTTLNVDSLVMHWVDQGAPRNKLIMGVAFYGRSFRLSNMWNATLPGSPSKGGGFAGPDNFIGYNELCQLVQRETWHVEWESHQKVPYAHNGSHWVGYESPRSIKLKGRYVLENDLAGVFVLGLDNDDFLGRCGGPLLGTLNLVFNGGDPGGDDGGDGGVVVAGVPKSSPASVFHIVSAKDRGRALQSECKPKSTKTLFPERVKVITRSKCGRQPGGDGVQRCTVYVQFADSSVGKELNAIVQFDINAEFFDRTAMHLF